MTAKTALARPLRRLGSSEPVRLSVEAFAVAVGLHPDLVRRLIALGLLEAVSDPAGQLWLSPSQLAAAARLQRLRSGLGLNYAALGVVVDLLDRVARLEAALAATTRPRQHGDRRWTPNG